MLFNINSVFIYFFYNNFKLFLNFSGKQKLSTFFYKNNLNFFFSTQTHNFKKYYYFFKYFYKVNNFFFIKCIQLLLYNYTHNYINTVYNITNIGINFFFLSNNPYFNFLWDINTSFFLNNTTKNSFMRFMVNFFKKNKIKMLIFFDDKFFNLLPFFKKMNFLTCGFISVKNNSKILDLPLYFNNTSLMSKYFFFNLTYKVYLLSLYYKYLKTFYTYIKNYNNYIFLNK